MAQKQSSGKKYNTKQIKKRPADYCKCFVVRSAAISVNESNTDNHSNTKLLFDRKFKINGGKNFGFVFIIYFVKMFHKI